MLTIPSVAVLVVTLFLSNGMMTSRAINAPTLDDCKAAAPYIVQQVEGQKIQIGDEKVTVDYADAQCIVATKGTHA